MDRDVRIQIEIERRRYLLGEKTKKKEKKRPDARTLWLTATRSAD